MPFLRPTSSPWTLRYKSHCTTLWYKHSGTRHPFGTWPRGLRLWYVRPRGVVTLLGFVEKWFYLVSKMYIMDRENHPVM